MIKKIRQKYGKIPVIRFLTSVKIMVVCLLTLFYLTLAGTVYQVYNGLYLAQERFFNSFVFLLGGFFPVPGAQLVLWILFINLVFVAIFRLEYTRKTIGLTIIHFGLLIYLVAAFFTFHFFF